MQWYCLRRITCSTAVVSAAVLRLYDRLLLVCSSAIRTRARYSLLLKEEKWVAELDDPIIAKD